MCFKNVLIYLIGNKSDLEDKRQVTYEEGKKFADENNLVFFETSALNGNNIVWDYLKNFYITKNVYRYDSNTRSAATAFLKNNIANVIQDSVIINYLPHDRIVYIKDQLNQNMDNRALGALNSQLEPILRLLFFELNSRAADKQSISINDLDTLRKSYENYKEKVFINNSSCSNCSKLPVRMQHGK